MSSNTTTNFKKRVTVSVGIPAFNESENIAHALRSVLKQTGHSFRILEVLVACDGSTDDTPKIVSEMSRHDPRIVCLRGRSRKGKAYRLNALYRAARGDYLLILDADVILDRFSEIERFVRAAQTHPRALVISGFLVGYSDTSFVGKINTAAFQLWYSITCSKRSGNVIYSLHGCASFLRRSLFSSLSYPSSVICDQHYLYMNATLRDTEGFYLAKNTRIIFRMPATLRDTCILATRSLRHDKENLISFFGQDAIDSFHVVSRGDKIRGVLSFLFSHPVFTILAVGLNILVRFILLVSARKTATVRWERVSSMKKAIVRS